MTICNSCKIYPLISFTVICKGYILILQILSCLPIVIFLWDTYFIMRGSHSLQSKLKITVQQLITFTGTSWHTWSGYCTTTILPRGRILGSQGSADCSQRSWEPISVFVWWGVPWKGSFLQRCHQRPYWRSEATWKFWQNGQRYDIFISWQD